MSFECPDCKKFFTTKQNKNKHIKNNTCKKQNININIVKNIM